jgi:RNA polymerase sigma-B factor
MPTNTIDSAPSTRDRLILANMDFVRALARRYGDRGEPLDDVVQAGMVGLINAADRYDPERGDFRSFAAPTVVGEIRRHFRDRTWSVSVPRRVKDDSIAVSQAIERLSADLGHTPTVQELADDLRIPADRVLDALGAHTAYSPDSLSHTPWLEDDEGARDVASVEEGFGLAEDRTVLAGVMGTLPARERVILHLRFEQGLLQSQIAARVGISQMHVSRLIARALARLREAA